jgi:hypothetical protein
VRNDSRKRKIEQVKSVINLELFGNVRVSQGASHKGALVRAAFRVTPERGPFHVISTGSNGKQ